MPGHGVGNLVSAMGGWWGRLSLVGLEIQTFAGAHVGAPGRQSSDCARYHDIRKHETGTTRTLIIVEHAVGMLTTDQVGQGACPSASGRERDALWAWPRCRRLRVLVLAFVLQVVYIETLRCIGLTTASCVMTRLWQTLAQLYKGETRHYPSHAKSVGG
jgi:hypothetical protein